VAGHEPDKGEWRELSPLSTSLILKGRPNVWPVSEAPVVPPLGVQDMFSPLCAGRMGEQGVQTSSSFLLLWTATSLGYSPS
jgi:hypothetical protein